VKRFLAAIAPLALALGLAACSSASGAQPSAQAGTTSAPAAGTVRVVAQNASFQAPSGDARANAAFDIDFVNQDSFPHNVQIVDASGSKVFDGDMITGGETTYHVSALAAGTYHVKCVVHPDMDATLTVK